MYAHLIANLVQSLTTSKHTICNSKTFWKIIQVSNTYYLIKCDGLEEWYKTKLIRLNNIVKERKSTTKCVGLVLNSTIYMNRRQLTMSRALIEL